MSDSQRIKNQGPQSYRDLTVWQLGMDLAERIYQLSAAFPKEERYGITSQIRRAVTSVPANISEGNARSSTKDYLRHLSIAVGSLAEVETFVELIIRLGFFDKQNMRPLLEKIGEERRMIRGLQRALRSRLSSP